jgi:UDP-N-acetylglucosamine--N-acetylmuramyl-(pentapeptide) pyrophosphoryl-undecaprenol N-acetylglucosamine transferase
MGTHEAPFHRMLDLFEPAMSDAPKVVVQYGHTTPRDSLPHAVWREYMSYEEVVDAMNSADTVICHAGVGTIMTALKLGHSPIVVPRFRRYDEHVDDHQVDIAERLEEQGLITCISPGQSPESIGTTRRTASEQDSSSKSALRNVVAGAIDMPHPSKLRVIQRF